MQLLHFDQISQKSQDNEATTYSIPQEPWVVVPNIFQSWYLIRDKPEKRTGLPDICNKDPTGRD